MTFLAQPARSPDFNALDLGAWFSLAAGVPAVRATEDASQKLTDRIINHVYKRWLEWDAMTRLENIFSTKIRVLQVVQDNNGTIDYKIPRSTKSHKHEGPSYMPSNE